jgi:hypothetical protein
MTSAIYIRLALVRYCIVLINTTVLLSLVPRVIQNEHATNGSFAYTASDRRRWHPPLFHGCAVRIFDSQFVVHHHVDPATRCRAKYVRHCRVGGQRSSHASPVTLDRPKALNALSSPLMKELNRALFAFDSDNSIGAVVITGNEKAFAGMV